MKDPEELLFLKEGTKTRVVRRKRVRFELLLRELTAVTKRVVNDDNRKTFHQIAWALGEAGEVEACEAIMKEAKEPEKKQSYNPYLYGYMYGHP